MGNRIQRGLAIGLLGVFLGWGGALPCWAEGVHAYFSQGGGIQKHVLHEISGSQKTIDLAIYSLTSQTLTDALVSAFHRGVKVRVVADLGQSRSRHSLTAYLQAAGIPLQYRTGKGRGIMHHKFAVFDGQRVLTGSYNWTTNAEAYSSENALTLDVPALAQQYTHEFERLWGGR